MKRDNETLQKIFEKTDCQCHICRKRLSFRNYGKVGARGAWEIEHSIPRSRGGTDHLNNLYAACISCNRSKGNASTKAARALNGFKCAPLPRRKKHDNAIAGAGLGALAALAFPIHLRLPLALVFAIAGAAVGKDVEAE